jgi:hypothetical protein
MLSLFQRNLFNRIASWHLCLLLFSSFFAQQTVAVSTRPRKSTTSGDAIQMAEILGVKPQLDRIIELQGHNDPSSQQEALILKSRVLQKTLLGYLEVRRASDKNWRELSYSYNITRRAQRRQDLINSCFTLANFAQLSALYTLEPYLRLNLYFKASAVCTQTSGGMALGLPLLNIAQQKIATVPNTEPPEAMQDYIDAGPVDGSGLPEYVDRFLDTPALGSVVSRREEMFALWKKRFGVDVSNKENLCGLTRECKSRRTLGMLYKRILLLWSLHTFILSMDDALLALVRQIEDHSERHFCPPASDSDLAQLGINPSALEVARLLNIRPEIAQLIRVNKSESNSLNDNFAKQELETFVLEKLLAASLEVRAAADQVNAETNYASDVVLAELLAKRGKKLQLNYEANFIQAGTFGSIAGLLYLKGHTKAGNEMFVISGGIGTGLSALAMHLMHGGSRAIDTDPNSLSDVFNLQNGSYRFSPFIAAYMASPPVGSKGGVSRTAELEKYWKEHKAITVNLDNKQTRRNLAAGPQAEADRIKIVTNRITMLHRLLYQIEQLDPELLDLLNATQYSASSSRENLVAQKANLTPAATEAAELLGLQPVVAQLKLAPSGAPDYDPSTLNARLLLVRTVFTTALDVRTTIDTLDGEISYESDVLGRMTRSRDQMVSMTNNANFFQLNILATIIDGPLGLSGDTRWVRASNMLNIVSGLAVGSLAGLTVIEQRGGNRPLPSRLNMLGQFLNMSPPDQYRFSPTLWRFIHNVPPNSTSGLTRVEQLRKIWREERGVYPNMDKQSVREKMAAFGPHHHERWESIKLIKHRLDLLYDVQGVVGLFDINLDDLLRSV